MKFGHSRTRWVQAGAALSAVALIAGCGSSYRPVVTPINTTGPSSQPTAYAITVSAPSATLPGIATIIDYSGDSIMAQAPIGPGPLAFSVDSYGGTGYTYNSDHTITNFPVSSTLQSKQVGITPLPSTAQLVNLYTPSSGLWAADLTGSVADVFTGSPQILQLSVPVAKTPLMVVGPTSVAQRYYVISQNIPFGVSCNNAPTTASQNGEADGIESTGGYTISSRLKLGKCPVYAVQSSDNRRLFVLNRGSDTITVINSQNNTLDGLFDAGGNCIPYKSQTNQTVTCHATLPLSLNAVAATGITPTNGTVGMAATAGPVYAEYNANTNQLIVSNYDGSTISVIDVSLDQYGNDSPTFGTTFTIPVGNNPASVTALADGSRAYTADQTDGTVTIVNLVSHTVEKTLPVIGNPRTVVSVQNSAYGKVYVASPNSPYLTILRTDQDIVDTSVLVEGNIVDVRVSTQNGNSGNSNVNSRTPGAGQPCYLPGSTASSTLANCQSQTPIAVVPST